MQDFTQEELTLISETILTAMNLLNNSTGYYSNINDTIKDRVGKLHELNNKVCGYRN